MDSAPQSSGAFANSVQQFEPLRDFFTSASLAAMSRFLASFHATCNAASV